MSYARRVAALSICWYWPENWYSVEIIRGVEEVVGRTRLRLALSVPMILSNLRSAGWLRFLIVQTDGAILVLTSVNRSISVHCVIIRSLLLLLIMVVNWARTFLCRGNELARGRTAIEYLLSLGHRRIATISGPSYLRCSQDRIAGYRSALEDASIPVDPALIRPGMFMQQTGYEQTCALLDLPEPPTAIFAGCDSQAMGVYSALRARGLSIPHDVSVVVLMMSLLLLS